MKTTDAGFALYVHWPFCLAKCPYCDFNSHVRPSVDHVQYRQALLDELAMSVERADCGPLRSIFFGGGTPSLMQPETAASLIDAAQKLMGFEDNIEITLEGNPTSTEAQKLRDFASAGINRLSLGVQSFDDTSLRFLGREHTSDEARVAIDLAAHAFDRFSFDLMYGRPEQTIDAWQKELERALSHGVSHLSLYQLTIEQGTAFYRWHRAGRFVMPDDALQADFYDGTLERLRSEGLARYEISNHARPGEECRHNLVYWNYGDYLGIGPGAHGRISRDGRKFGTSVERVPERWLRAVETRNPPEEELIEPSDQMVEYLIMGLRLESGVDQARLACMQENLTSPVLDQREVDKLVDEGLLRQSKGRLACTDRGFLQLDAILRTIIN